MLTRNFCFKQVCVWERRGPNWCSLHFSNDLIHSGEPPSTRSASHHSSKPWSIHLEKLHRGFKDDLGGCPPYCHISTSCSTHQDPCHSVQLCGLCPAVYGLGCTQGIHLTYTWNKGTFFVWPNVLGELARGTPSSVNSPLNTVTSRKLIKQVKKLTAKIFLRERAINGIVREWEVKRLNLML